MGGGKKVLQNDKSVLISLYTSVSVNVIQVLVSEAGAEVAAGVAEVEADTAPAEVAGAEMVASAVMVAVCTVCRVLYKDTPAVKIL